VVQGQGHEVLGRGQELANWSLRTRTFLRTTTLGYSVKKHKISLPNQTLLHISYRTTWQRYM